MHSLKEVLGHRQRHFGNNMDGPENDHEEHDYRMTWYHKVVWVVHDMITGAAPVVSSVHDDMVQCSAFQGGDLGKGGSLSY